MHRFLWALLAVSIPAAAQSSWKFAVSGDSRNCGGVVMPAIAAAVTSSRASFYWHLGDFRAIYTFDEDMVPKPATITDYESRAWPDFIARQLAPFGHLPVYLAPGNHEMIPPATRERYLIQFADWLSTETLRSQRLADDPQDHALRAYYHWRSGPVDFISLDNATPDQFDAAQMRWLRALLARDEQAGDVRSIVVGMHAALPGSFGHSHSMEDWAQGAVSGRQVYEALWNAQEAAHKHVYLLASHSHFFMEDVFRTDTWKDKVLPGWIVGTAGAVRYRLPPGAGPEHKAAADTYGWLLGTVAADGAVAFTFQPLSLDDLLRANAGRAPEALVRWCYAENKQ